MLAGVLRGVRNPLIVLVGISGAGTIVRKKPYKSSSQGNRHGKEVAISEEPSEGSLDKCCLLLPRRIFVRDLQLLNACGHHPRKNYLQSL